MLKRKYARLCILLLALTFLIIALPVLMYEFAGSDLALWGMVGIGGAVICMALITAVRFYCLRCPSCGKGLARPYWNPSPNHEQFCVKCGKPFVYDDEV